MMRNRVYALLLAVFSCAFAQAAAKSSPFTVDGLKCENMRAPLGIDNTSPHFSWLLHTPGRGDRQTAYEIQVASDAALLSAGRPDMWASGKVASGKSVMVEYAGRTLMPRCIYYWRVRSWNKDGVVSAWSRVSRFSVGALGGLTGRFVGMAKGNGDMRSPLIRKKIKVTPGATVLAHVNSLGYHELYVNGRKVDDSVLSPAVSQLDRRSLIVTYDITPCLLSGATEADIVIWAGQGWYKPTTFGAVYGGPLVRADIDEVDGQSWRTIARTDTTWTAASGGYADTGTWNALQFGGERVDGRIVPTDMSTESLDRRAWYRVAEVAVPGMQATPQMCESNTIISTVRPVSVTKTADGAWLIDMGRVFTGWLRLSPGDMPAGREVRMEYADHIFPDKGFESQGESDIYITAGRQGETFCNKFNHHAFRYVRVTGTEKRPRCTGLQISGGYEPAASFECSDADLNAIHNMIFRTLRCLTFSGYMVDCPHLERTGYGGDGNSSTMTLQTMYDVAPTYYNWLQAWGDVIEPDGSLPHVAPAGGGGGGPYWCGFIIKAPWRTMLNYGDDRTMRLRYADMCSWLSYVDRYTTDGLLGRWPDTHNRIWYLGDWLTPAGVDAGDGRSVELVSNCFVSDCLESITRIARILGHTADADAFEQRRLKLNRTIHNRFYNAADSTYATGSPLDMSYAMLTGVVPDSLYEGVHRKLVELSRGKYRTHIAVGLTGVPVFTEWATRNHETELMYDILKQRDYPGYLYMIDNGATTTWESWNADRSRVHNCYNGIGTWFYQALGGIVPDEDAPGCAHLTIDPQYADHLDWAQASRETPYGRVRTRWQRTAEGIRLYVELPVGVTATLRLPEGVEKCTVDGRRISRKARTTELVQGTTRIEMYMR